MKRVLAVSFVLFVITLAVVIGQRMSTDAMAVVIGVIFGVVASIPTSLLIMAASRRSSQDHSTMSPSYPDRYFPPVIIVNPNELGTRWAPSAPGPESLPPPSHRRFRIVGDDGEVDLWDDDFIDARDWREA
ncbi:MAG TPA: hypothetical protein G4O02_18180 [Caldilineae bacterium]|nr:hypothetical protein [Caldilineae bacterium]